MLTIDQIIASRAQREEGAPVSRDYSSPASILEEYEEQNPVREKKSDPKEHYSE